MLIKCSKTNLQKSINIAMRAIPTRTTMPIMECILIDASTTIIKLIANDTDIGVETVVEGTILERGTVALDAKILDQMVRKLPEENVTIKTADNYQTTVTCGKAKFNIHGLSDETFIQLPFYEKKGNISLSQLMLKDMIRQTIFSIAVSENNNLMTGEFFEIKNNTLSIISLDGHRIAIRRMPLAEDFDDTSVIIPGKTLSEIAKILSSEVSDNVNLYFENNQIVFEMDQTIMISRLIEGNYYNVNQMMPRDFDTRVNINRKELLECIDRSSLLIKEVDKKPLILDIQDQMIEIKINTGMGSMDEQIDIEKTGKDITIAFNPKFLMDALRVIDDETISIYLSNPKAPCVIQNEDKSYIYLILPINIDTGN